MARRKELPEVNSERSAKWDGRAKGSTLGNWIFMRIISLAGPFAAYPLLVMVAAWYGLTNKKLAATIRDFRTTLGLPCRFSDIWRHVFSFGTNLIDGISFLVASKPSFRLSCIGEEQIPQLLSRGQGLILLSAHVGSWEIAGNLLNDRIQTPINPVMLDNEKEAIKKVFNKATARRRMNVIPLNGDGFDLMLRVREALKRNEIVCFLGDRVRGGEASAVVDFCGRPARFPLGPFAVAAITGAPVLVTFTVKQGLRRYVFKAWGTFTIEGVTRANRQEKILEGLRAYVKILEQVVAAHPHQWYNFYPFWEEPLPAPVAAEPVPVAP
jgi:predicted LPLAT superfamily acyltransferase